MFFVKLHWYLNENQKIHVIFGFCYKIMSFRDLTKLLAMALKSARSNPQHLKKILCHFHTNFSTLIHVHNVAMKMKNVAIRWRPLCAFCWTHHHIIWQNSMIVSLSYPYMMNIYLFIRFMYVTKLSEEKLRS